MELQPRIKMIINSMSIPNPPIRRIEITGSPVPGREVVGMETGTVVIGAWAEAAVVAAVVGIHLVPAAVGTFVGEGVVLFGLVLAFLAFCFGWGVRLFVCLFVWCLVGGDGERGKAGGLSKIKIKNENKGKGKAESSEEGGEEGKGKGKPIPVGCIQNASVHVNRSVFPYILVLKS